MVCFICCIFLYGSKVKYDESDFFVQSRSVGVPFLHKIFEAIKFSQLFLSLTFFKIISHIN